LRLSAILRSEVVRRGEVPASRGPGYLETPAFRQPGPGIRVAALSAGLASHPGADRGTRAGEPGRAGVAISGASLEPAARRARPRALDLPESQGRLHRRG